MREHTFLLPTFLLSLFLVFIIFFLGRFGFLGFISNPIQASIFSLTAIVHGNSSNQTTQLQKENIELSQQLVAFKKTQLDNQALQDQFQTSSPLPQNLVPTHVVGMEGGSPLISFPDFLIISLGKRTGSTNGSVVVVKSDYIGIVTSVSDYYSQILLPTSKGSSFSAKDLQTNALGILQGQGGGEMLFTNVLLSDSLQKGDMLVTLGSQTIQGSGTPPGLIVGKIVSVEKNPSNLFQSASVVTLLPLDHLNMVFVIKP